MLKIIKDKNKSFRFRRYSRNSYAVFLSLNKVITIGKLAGYIADKGLSKTPSVNDFCYNYSSKFNLEENPPDDDFFDNNIINNNLQIIRTDFIGTKNIEQDNCIYNKYQILTQPIFSKD